MTDTTTASDTPGRLLATARVRAGLTLGDVAARSKVPVAALEAIDEDDYRRIGAPVYARGFVRLYAREVGLDPAVPIALLDHALADAIVTAPEPPRTPDAPARRPAEVRRRRRRHHALILPCDLSARAPRQRHGERQQPTERSHPRLPVRSWPERHSHRLPGAGGPRPVSRGSDPQPRMLYPPSTAIVCPWIIAAPGEHRNFTKAATSPASHNRPVGVRSFAISMSWSWLANC